MTEKTYLKYSVWWVILGECHEPIQSTFFNDKINAVKNLRKLELSKIADTNIYWKKPVYKIEFLTHMHMHAITYH